MQLKALVERNNATIKELRNEGEIKDRIISELAVDVHHHHHTLVNSVTRYGRHEE